MTAFTRDEERLAAAKSNGTASALDVAVLAFEAHATYRPFDPDAQPDTAAPAIADTIRDTERAYGFERRAWPRRLLIAAAPFDALAQLALGGTVARRTRSRLRADSSAIRPPAHVRTHRPHRITGTDWAPSIPTNDLAIPSYGRTD